MKLVLYICAATASATVTGALLGQLGAQIPREPRVGVATLLGAVAVGVGALEVSGRRVRPLQCDRETPQSWIHRGAVRWAVMNGAALGIGAWSRIGFWLWYVVPLGSLLIADPRVGAAIYGSYGFGRSAAALGLVLVARRSADFQTVADRVLQGHRSAQLGAGCYLLLTGAAVSVGVGI